MGYHSFVFSGLCLLLSSQLVASTTATVVVTFSIASINAISFSGNPAPLVVNSATAGQQPTTAVDMTTTYSVTTNSADALTVTAELDAAMPQGTELAVELTAPTGATSLGEVALTTTPVNLLTGISSVAQTGLVVCYELEADVTATPVTNATRTVTYTLQ